jgi:hypothetical protein
MRLEKIRKIAKLVKIADTRIHNHGAGETVRIGLKWPQDTIQWRAFVKKSKNHGLL